MIALHQPRYSPASLVVALAISMWVVAAGTRAQSPTGSAIPTAASPTPVATEDADPNATPTMQPSVPLTSSTIEEYRARLRRAERELRGMEAKAPRNLPKVLSPLAKSFRLKRADGESQTAGGDEWQRRIDDWENSNSRSNTNNDGAPVSQRTQVQGARLAVAARLQALDNWTTQRDGKYFEPAANAQNIMQQLEASGEIRTGPTALQMWWASVMKWLGDTFEAFVKWIGGLFPAPSANVRPINFNPQLLQALFALAVVALLGVVGFLVWRAVGGNWGRNSARREVRFEGEDAELLQLPPDELTERARAWAERGNFREALRHLYIALLLNLDRSGVWRYDSRRTNWEHIAALRHGAIQSTLREANAPLVEPLSDLTRRFDRVRYGDAPCSSDDWTRFLHDVEHLRAQLNNPPMPRDAARSVGGSR
jgi:hypothetical protein